MDLLSDILSHMRLSGTLYFRTAFTSPWSVRVPSFENVARFHFAHKGRCLVRIVPDEPPVLLEQGDLIIIMRGAAHTLYCDPKTENEAVQLERVVRESGFTGKGALVYGPTGTDHATQLVCGHFAFGPDAGTLLLDALPSHIHIANYGEAAGSWMAETLKVIGAEAGRGGLGGDLIALKLSEIIFAQALRTYLATAGAERPVLAGIADAHIALALTAIHQNPGFGWTLEALARTGGMSRTAFVSRFAHCMRMTPMAYVTYWRMQLARQLLARTSEPIIEIAERVGYGSEAAFSRVFKKHQATAPAAYRRAVRLSSGLT
ncbi:AraC family transcriptional regulator [Nitratireductor pacificus pht-3B]|uniref:AraC family transcriptional regulator n=2 Tax=Nitratireductor TaxID=245876 RepID=K2N1D1_9HYPH|nr:AraC family transcriptional regulator [Nitratireductor pacificus pht-3B]